MKHSAVQLGPEPAEKGAAEQVVTLPRFSPNRLSARAQVHQWFQNSDIVLECCS
jgi:hypothetical protein